MNSITRLSLLAIVWLAGLDALAQAEPSRRPANAPFLIAVLPDTQNYLDYTQQRATGFPIDAKELFFDQMAFVRRNLISEGGDIAFVTAVGDVWQTPSSTTMDAPHKALGLTEDPANPLLKVFKGNPAGVAAEMTTAREGYEIIAGRTPFAVAPGNHDYDAFWIDGRPFKGPTPIPGLGQLHYGGLDSFRAVFGAESAFFRKRPWYVASYNAGADSAQLFEAGGYRFLHIVLEMAPADDVLAWASAVIARYKGLPTIVSIHDHLNPAGERAPIPFVNFKAVHPDHNDPEDLWAKFLSREDQIFLVLSGHQNGQSRRIDTNAQGHQVIQLLSDYQDRTEVLRAFYPDRKIKSHGLGDGWMRLMRFDLTAPRPSVRVRTYSTYFHAYANEFPPYAGWYKSAEQPSLSDEAFLAQEDFSVELTDFHARFGQPGKARR